MPSMKATMDEYKAGSLHSGSKSGPVVKNRKQAIAIGLREERAATGKPRKPKSKKPRDTVKGLVKSAAKRLRHG